LSHYRYLCKQAAPKVDVKRDIGAPPKFIKELEDHVRMEMTEPELGAKYRLMRCRTKLLTGVSGSGKTLSIQGLWRSIYGVMSDVTGVPIEDLPFRVLRLRAGSVLSKWYSESEKQLDKFFDEVEQLADEYFELPNGQMVLLPVIVICEEIDGLARTRGSDSVSDRVQTTLLQRLDATSQRMRDQLILYLFTSNVPELIDPAFLRRAGGTIERFDRLNRRACSEVLDKHLRDLPLREDDATRLNGAALRRVKGAILPWLYSANGEDRGLVEITYVGATEPEVKYRRDFLTGALIARAIQEASEQGRAAEWSGRAPGVTTSYLTSAIASQVGSIVDQLHQHNVNQYVSLPEGARVASVRRISQPKRLPPQLMRNP
jgi:SpoVK/Ycf46/Vps4 family AAA+-type ATPase